MLISCCPAAATWLRGCPAFQTPLTDVPMADAISDLLPGMPTCKQPSTAIEDTANTLLASSCAAAGNPSRWRGYPRRRCGTLCRSLLPVCRRIEIRLGYARTSTLALATTRSRAAGYIHILSNPRRTVKTRLSFKDSHKDWNSTARRGERRSCDPPGYQGRQGSVVQSRLLRPLTGGV